MKNYETQIKKPTFLHGGFAAVVGAYAVSSSAFPMALRPSRASLHTFIGVTFA